MLHGGTTNLNPTYWHLKQTKFVLFHAYPRIRQSGISWLAAIKVTPRGRVLTDAVNEVEVPEQATNDILLVDPYNQGYEELPDDATDEAHED